MPRKRDEENRVIGPTWIPSRERWRVVIITPEAVDPRERTRTRHFREEADANEVADDQRLTLLRFESTTVGQAIDAYREYLVVKGTGSQSYDETTRRLKLFFPNHLLTIARVTPDRCKDYYEVFRAREKIGKGGKVVGTISVAYHRGALINARSFLAWCMERGWLVSNPLANVKGVGRRSRGKMQHTGNESHKLYTYLLPRAQAGDEAAIGVLLAVLLTLRSSDLTRRVVRDVDQNATVLRILEGKTDASNRPRTLPTVLQPAMAKLVEGREPFAPLFWTPYTADGHHTRRWLEEAMVRFCKAAGVPYVCPHALKGTGGTILAKKGEHADTIAEYLSHEQVTTTVRHYIAPGALEDAQAERAFQVISGGKKK